MTEVGFPISIKSFLTTLVYALLLRFVVVSIYRVTYHPLAKYPGPLLAKFTNLYAAWHAFKGDIHLVTSACHDRYGDFVRFGPNRLIINTVTAYEEIYRSSNVKKAKGYALLTPSPGVFSILSAIDKQMHRRKRRCISQGFSEDALRRFEPLMLHHIDIFVKLLLDGSAGSETGWGPTKNFAEYVNYLAFDIMGQYGFGRAFRMQETTENRFFQEIIAINHVRTSAYVQYPELSWLGLEIFFLPKLLPMRNKFLNLTRGLAEARLKEGNSDRADVFTFISDTKDPETGQGLSLEELWAEVALLIVAGSDTTSTALAAVMFYICRNPKCYEKLVSEIRGAFSRSEDIHAGSSMASCSYLQACINESLRMSPSVGSAPWREVTGVGIEVDGHWIPAGIDIGTSVYALHHNEAYYPDRHNFRPERWLSNEGVLPEATRRAFASFQIGPRGCIGRAFAYMEMTNTLAKLLWHADVRRPEGISGQVSEGKLSSGDFRHRQSEFQLYDHITSNKYGPCVEVRMRSP